MTVLSLNAWSDVHPLGALMTAIFAGWVLQRDTTEDEFNVKSRHAIWDPLVRYVAPVGILAIFVFNLL